MPCAVPLEGGLAWLLAVLFPFRSLSSSGLAGLELPSIHMPGLVITSLSGEMIEAWLASVASTKMPSGFNSPMKGVALSGEACWLAAWVCAWIWGGAGGAAAWACVCSRIRRSCEAASVATRSRSVEVSDSSGGR